MDPRKDYYKALGVAKTASQDEIKSAYRKLARTYHPDINKEPDAEARFKEVGEANDVIGTPEKRAEYDAAVSELEAYARSGGAARGRTRQRAQDFQHAQDFEFTGAGGFSPGDSDMFEQMFRSARRKGGDPREEHATFDARGEDQHARIVISLADALNGAERTMSLSVPEISPNGRITMKDRTLQVKIPQGILEGQHIRLKGQGSPGFGKGPPGDLYIEVAYEPDRLYRVSGRDLYLDLPVTPSEAALGASVEMPTPKGAIMLKVPPGSETGKELRVKGRGIPASEPGDLYAVLKIVAPPAATPEARAAYEALAKATSSFDPRSRLTR